MGKTFVNQLSNFPLLDAFDHVDYAFQMLIIFGGVSRVRLCRFDTHGHGNYSEQAKGEIPKL